MKVKIKYHKTEFSDKDKQLMSDFMKYLQKSYPVNKNITVIFTGERYGDMSTGSRTDNSELKILTKKRINRDIMRTLAHEWVHEWQMSTKKEKKGPNIGGHMEDEANAKAGSIIKKFEKDNKEREELVYEGINKRLNLINEEILLTEKQNIRKDFIMEMKKIGIEKLPYSYSSLNKFVDPETMDIHYNKHYKGYVKKLNDALKNKKGDLELEDIIKDISKYDDKVRNNAGGAFNHALFWKMLSPKKQTPKGEILRRINNQYGNIKKMKDEFNQIATERFGSGWVWLILTKNNKLKVMSTPNQDNPLMNIVKDGGKPLLGLDLWEHAYYLRYRNKRDKYIKNFWNCVNWDFVNELLEKSTQKKLNESHNKKSLLNEVKRAFPLAPRTFKKLINTSYPPCEGRKYRNGCLGKIETKKCTTELGVIGGKFSERKYGGIGNWSIINRFDTNSKVHNEIERIFIEETDALEDFKNWILKNILELVGNNGKYTKRLVDINAETIREGALTENYAKNVIIKEFNLNPDEEGMTWRIIERCAGDIRDRKLGQDFDVIIEGKSYFFQVKPMDYVDIKKFGSERGYYYQVPSWHNHSKYKQENVDVIMYVDRNNDKYILFRNDYSKIQTIANPDRYKNLYFIYYYENPLKSNFDVEVTPEQERIESKPKLQRDKNDLIKYYQERINYYQDMINKLGDSEKIQERVNRLENKLYNLLKEDIYI